MTGAFHQATCTRSKITYTKSHTANSALPIRDMNTSSNGSSDSRRDIPTSHPGISNIASVGCCDAEVRGQRSEVRGQRSEVRGQKSEVRGQKSEVRGQRSEVRDKRNLVRT